jgi:uridine kinase
LSSPDPVSAVTVLARPVLHALTGAGPGCVVLLDGPSGAGKSTLADVLMQRWPGSGHPSLLRLDDIYPGWDGLDVAIDQLTECVLRPRRAGRPAAWQRYDWDRGEPAEWHPVDAGHPLIVEGCGALASANVGLSDLRVWLTADDAVRRHRALERDGEVFRSHWDQWQSDWVAYHERETPERWATHTLTSG